MNKMLTVQITLLVLIAGALGGMLLYTDVYDDIKSTIVDITCFSCIKMDPVTRIDFTFKTVDNQNHPGFILENLLEGPVFLAFREDVCGGCDKMEPIIQKIFNTYFEKEDFVYETINYSGTPVVFYHISLDHASDEMIEPFFVYDKDQRSGVPMFVMITLGDNKGQIQPYYATAYSTLGLEKNSKREALMREIIKQGIEYYNQNQEGYNYTV